MARRELIKGLALLPILAGMMASIVGWGFPDAGWSVRLLGFVLIAGGIALFLKVHFVADQAPDYLARLFPKFFDRNGLCFFPIVLSKKGRTVIRIFFQTRHDSRTIGEIVLQPRKKSLGGYSIEIDCPPGGFGFVDVDAVFPARLASDEVVFNVGASAGYPEGRGRGLRFRDGIPLRTDIDFNRNLRAAVTIAGALTGHLVLSSPATLTLRLPAKLHQSKKTRPPKTKVLWQSGADELNEEQLARYLGP